MEEVLHDLCSVERIAGELGLQLNLGKTKIIFSDTATMNTMLQEVPGLFVIKRERATLLGSPIGGIEGLRDTLMAKTRSLGVVGNRLQHLHAHDALCLLRHAFVLPKLLHILCTSPCFFAPELQVFDSLIRSLLSSIMNINLTDSAWSQASLPVRCGGLEDCSATLLAPSVFLASAAGSADLVHDILPPRLQNASYQVQVEALECWSQGHNAPPPSAPTFHRQRAWDEPRVAAVADALLGAASDDRTHARLLASKRVESGAWLQALPISSLGLRMDDDTLRVAAGLRLRATLCQPHTCQHCGSAVDEFALHGLSCRKSQGHHPCHAAINMLLQRALASARVPSHLEPPGILRADGKRPDGASVTPRKRGQILVWDATQAPLLHHMLYWLPERPVQLPSKQSNRRIESTLTSAPPITFRPLQWRPPVPLVLRPCPSCQTLVGLSGLRLESLSPTNSSCRASLWQYNEGMQHRSGVLHM